VAIESSSLEAIIGAQAEKIGGVQPKFTVDVSSDGMMFVPAEGGRFIVKPQWKRKHLPQNEHLSMCLARLVGVEVASCALLSQMDGVLVYVTKRFDRIEDNPPRSRHQLDFCQLLNIAQERKYDHPASLCTDVIVENSIDPDGDLAKLFQLFVFCYWTGNGDLHLKNLSLVDRGGYRLAPAYDLACSYVFGDEKLALYVRNRQKDIPRREWLAFAATCRLDETRAAIIIDSMLARYHDCLAMIGRSGLPGDHRPAYMRCLTKRRRALMGPGSSAARGPTIHA
jgi:serine/threonine-protein kinase HipA